MVSELDRATRQAYDDAADAWASGPERVYGRLAAALLDRCPMPLDGAQLLDIGAGTGVLGDAAHARGANCVDVDVAIDMLAHIARRDRRPARGVGADGRALPFPDSTFDAAAANCSLSHVPDPDRMLGEAVRVVRRGGALACSAFPSVTTSHDAWSIVEQVLTEHGYRRPGWYAHLKAATEPQVGTIAALAQLGRAIGLVDVEVARIRVETGLDDSAALADWRLGMAQHAAFLGSIGADRRAAIRAEAITRIGERPQPLGVDMLVLCGHVR